MNGNLRYQIEYALKANADNANALKSMLDLFGKLEPEGWTPEIYAECVKELQRVQMCVIHRSLAHDLIKLIDATDPAYLKDDDPDDQDITAPILGRFRDSLNQALRGIPPGTKVSLAR